MLSAETSPAAESFVVFSDDWGEHPSSCQHLFRQIASEHKVLWVNTIGMRNPTLSWTDLRKAARKGLRMLRGGSSSGGRVERPRFLDVSQPLMLPYGTIAPIGVFNRGSVIRSVRRAMAAMGICNPVVVSTVPNACDIVTRLDASTIVYYCVDDFTQWPGLLHDAVHAMEQRLIAQSDVLIATSQALYAKLAQAGKPLSLLTHGVDLAHFSTQAASEHPRLSAIPRPRIGYFGLFDERNDQRLIAALAERIPDTAVVIAGPVVVDVSTLSRLPNVHFLGPIPYGELPALVKGLSALLVPYVVNRAMEAISPLKLKEYLATGRPVISTPIPEARHHERRVFIASDAMQWEQAVRAAGTANVESRRKEMLQYLKAESWSHKARQFRELCSAPRPATR